MVMDVMVAVGTVDIDLKINPQTLIGQTVYNGRHL